jgi:hypothetical protein
MRVHFLVVICVAQTMADAADDASFPASDPPAAGGPGL